jgi:hypothetical protein
MSVNTTGKHSHSATILIETRQIPSNQEKEIGQPGLRCFISTAWDLLHVRPIDRTLAKATIRSLEMLSKSSTDTFGPSSQCHLKRWYGYYGVPYEVCVTHNDCVWLRPIGTRRLAANVRSYDARFLKQDLKRQATASPYVRVQPIKGQRLRKSRASFAEQPSEIQRLVGYYFESVYCIAAATKYELARRMQAEIQAMNLSRPCDQQLNIPPLKTLCFFMDEYYFFALSNGHAVKRPTVKLLAGESSKPFERQANQSREQSSHELGE